jgi:shikimate kinase
MVVGIMGESCTGKSSVAEELSKQTGAKIYTGKDYMKLAKGETEAAEKFASLLKANQTGGENLIYVISEKEHIRLLPEKAVRILMCADIGTIKERFAKRMNGKLPPPVEAMLEQKYGSFDGEKHDLRVDNKGESISAICGRIIELCGRFCDKNF